MPGNLDQIEVGCWSFEQTTPESAAALAIPEYAMRQLPQASLRAIIKSEPAVVQQPAGTEPGVATPECRVVFISISWISSRGRPPTTAENTIWKIR